MSLIDSATTTTRNKVEAPAADISSPNGRRKTELLRPNSSPNKKKTIYESN
jgi:hypothetical protein